MPDNLLLASIPYVTFECLRVTSISAGDLSTIYITMEWLSVRHFLAKHNWNAESNSQLSLRNAAMHTYCPGLWEEWHEFQWL